MRNARINQEIHSSPPPARVDRWDYSADIEMHILSLHADELLQLRFISNILRWFGFNWQIQSQCANPYSVPVRPTYTVFSTQEICPALQRCNSVNLVWGYTWNYQLSDTVIWLSDVNRAGVWWRLRSDGDLHRADYFSIIHSQQKIITLSRASSVDWSNQIIRDGTTPTAIWLWRSWVILLGCSLLVCRCTAGCSRSEWHFWCEAFWPVSEVVYCCSDCLGEQKLPLGCKQGDVGLQVLFRFVVNSIFSKWLFLPLSTSASHKWASSGQNMVNSQLTKVSDSKIFGSRSTAWVCMQRFRCFTFLVNFLFLLVCFFNDI